MVDESKHGVALKSGSWLFVRALQVRSNVAQRPKQMEPKYQLDMFQSTKHGTIYRLEESLRFGRSAVAAAIKPFLLKSRSTAIIVPLCLYMNLALHRFSRSPHPIRRGSSYLSLRRLTFTNQVMANVQENAKASVATTPQSLPKLSPSEFRIYNSMADHMDLFVPSSSVSHCCGLGS